MHNSNLLALAAVLLSDPTCGAGGAAAPALPCAAGSPARRLYYLVPPRDGKADLQHSRLLAPLFGDEGGPRAAAELLGGDGVARCVARVSWGPGPALLNVRGGAHVR